VYEKIADDSLSATPTNSAPRGESSAKDIVSDNNNNINTEAEFSLKKPVEQTKDLIAVHNLNSEKLLSTLDLGGFPMPSIAVTKAELGHKYDTPKLEGYSTGLGSFKAAAYLAVPKVIENGEIVDFRDDWKNRGYQTAVIVGLVSVEVDGENYNALCGVVVSNQRGIDDAYVHDVGLILENGTPYKTKSSNSAALSGGVPFPNLYNVLQDVANVNGEQLERFNTWRTVRKIQYLENS